MFFCLIEKNFINGIKNISKIFITSYSKLFLDTRQYEYLIHEYHGITESIKEEVNKAFVKTDYSGNAKPYMTNKNEPFWHDFDPLFEKGVVHREQVKESPNPWCLRFIGGYCIF